nr:peptidoglycan-binding domain-containing protein [Pacificibacter maritimus]
MAAPNDEILRAGDAATAPPGADPAACFGRHTTPAIVETVTEQVVVQPPQISADGTVSYPATYRTETRQEIVRERKELWFETLCEDALTPDFVASVQRALAVRGQYSGNANGKMDRATRRAIRAYQSAQGLDSEILSLAAARKLGLVALPRDDRDTAQ